MPHLKYSKTFIWKN